MSIASELLQLNTNKINIKAAIEAKNPSIAPTDNLSQWPESIGSIAVQKEEQSKTVTPTSNGVTVLPDSGKVLSSVVVNGDNDLVSSNIKSGVNIFGVTGNVVELKGETRTVSPSTTQQTITPTTGKNAITQITVNPVTNSIDANISASNIKSGVTILGVNGNVIELKGETKTITPTTSQQTVTPSSGKNAITQVTVNPVTSSIDSNIVAGNIKKDISILGVTGSYEGSGGGGTEVGYNVELRPGYDSGGSISSSYTLICYKTDGSEVTINTQGTCSDVKYVKVIPHQTQNREKTLEIYGQTELNNLDIRNNQFYIIKILSDTIFQAHDYGCLLKGTKVFLNNGSEKNIEDIQYNDELLVWDFDNGCLSSSKPLWIKKKENCGYYFVNKYKSGKELLTTGQSSTGWGHRTFDLNKNKFIYTTESVSDNIYTLDGADIHMSCSRIEENCEFYNIITEKHFNLFANRILTSCSLNNLYPIKDMKYLKDNRGLRSFEEYSGITKEYFDGLRLSENNSDISQINSYVQKLLNNRI